MDIKDLIERDTSDVDKIIFQITEGVYDPGILKAVFLAGGPGSGKSFTGNDLFGIPQNMKNISFSSFGLKVVASDRSFEAALRKHDMSVDLSSMSQAEHDKAMSIRDRAKEVMAKMERNWINGRLGLLMDQTSRHGSQTKNQKTVLESLGYDTMMLFVNTTLEVAIERNNSRPRKLPLEVVEGAWHEAQKAKQILRGVFGSDFIEIDNSVHRDASRAVSAFPDEINKRIRSFVTSPVRNPTGQLWIQRALELKNSL